MESIEPDPSLKKESPKSPFKMCGKIVLQIIAVHINREKESQ